MSDGPGFSYEAFADWYDRHRAVALEPALELGRARLDELLTEALPDRDRARLRVAEGRVKTRQRTWRKLSGAPYAGRARSVKDVPAVIDDLVGLRVTCTNARDIEVVQAVLETLPRRAGAGLWLAPGSERDYLVTPKDSGYRGYHVNLVVAVPRPDGGRPRQVTAELQVRTLLQDSWGELTHEDTYHADSPVPPLVAILSRRLADLLATIDDVAEDLRDELDRIEAASVEGVGEAATGRPAAVPPGEHDEAAARLRERWRALDRPIDLGSMAWSLQREFGTEISDGWYGYRSFKAFLLAVLPEAELTTGDRPYLLPPSGREPAPAPAVPAPAPVEGEDDGAPSTIPEVARRLKRADRGFPLLERDQWPGLFDHLAAAWAQVARDRGDAATLAQVTRTARDRSAGAGDPVSRRHLDHVASAVVAGHLDEPVAADEIARRYADAVVDRLESLRLTTDPADLDAVRAWLLPA